MPMHAELLWDIDEGVLILGDDIEFKTSEPMKIVKWLNSLGVTVHFTNQEEGTKTIYVAEEDEDEYEDQPDTMLKVKGITYRCECGANVFKKSKKTPALYRCNGCRNILISE